MVDSVMNVVSSLVPCDTSKVDVSPTDNGPQNPNEFEHILELLMAQMGLCMNTSLPLNPDLLNRNAETGDMQNDGAQIHDISTPNMGDSTLLEVNANVLSVTDSDSPLLTESSSVVSPAIELSTLRGNEKKVVSTMVFSTENNNELQNLIAKQLEEIVTNLKSLIKVEGENGTSDGGEVLSGNLQLKGSINQGEPPISYVKNVSADVQKLLFLVETFLSKDVGDEDFNLQSKLNIEGIGVSPVRITKNLDADLLQKLDLVLQKEMNQKDPGNGENQFQTKIGDLLSGIKRYISENTETLVKDPVISKMLKLEGNSFQSEQTGENHEKKINLSPSDLTLNEISIKSPLGKEKSVNPSTSFSSLTSKEVGDIGTSIRAQIIEQIKLAMKPDTKTLVVKLEPESLGTIEIQVQDHSGNIGIQLTTYSDDVHKILSQSLPQLKEVLQQEGISVKDIQVVSPPNVHLMANLMSNQSFQGRSDPHEIQGISMLYPVSQETQCIDENKPILSYHDGTLNLWV